MTRPIYLRDVDVAAMFVVSRQTVWTWANTGKLPQPIRISPKCTRWNLVEIQAMYPTQLAG